MVSPRAMEGDKSSASYLTWFSLSVAVDSRLLFAEQVSNASDRHFSFTVYVPR